MEFQAIVLAAGKGSRMSHITSKLPKALLPIGPRPMVWYALNMLQSHGFKEAIIVLPASQRLEIMTQLQSYNDIKLKLTEEFVQNVEEITEVGTADVLRNIIKARDVKKDLLVVTSDIMTEVNLDPLLSLHYVRNSALTVLFTPITEAFLASPVPGPKTKRKVEKDLIGIECKNKRLMFMASEADFEDEMSIKQRVLKCCRQFQIFSNLQDSHVYIISKSTFDLWADNKEINSVKGDLIPYLCRKQFSVRDVEPSESESVISYTAEMTSWNGENNNFNTEISCFAFVDQSSFSIRANNLASYMYSNKQLSRLWSKFSSDPSFTNIHSSVQIGEKSIIGNDCFIWKNTTIGSQSIIKGSVIGYECKIGNNVKLTNCIILDKSVINDGCILQGTIVCCESILQEGWNINNSVVAVDQVSAGTKMSNEIITNEEKFMEI